MVFYAERSVRRTRQIVIDLLFLAWVLIAVWIGVQVHDAVTHVADQARKVDTASTNLGERLSGAGDTLGSTPLIGDGLDNPFDAAADSAANIGQAGSDTADSIETLGTLLGWAAVLVLVLLAAPYYLPPRVRFIATATILRRLAERAERDPDVPHFSGFPARQRGPRVLVAPDSAADLLALRSLAERSIWRLGSVPAAATGWRDADAGTVAALANLHLRANGLRARYATDVPDGAPEGDPPLLPGG